MYTHIVYLYLYVILLLTIINELPPFGINMHHPPKKNKKEVGRWVETLYSNSSPPSDEDAPLRSLKLVVGREIH